MSSAVLRDGTLVIATETGSLVVLPGGASVLGEPHATDEYRATAAGLGYGADVLAMCRDHDPLHALLADWLGLTSCSLRQIAGEPADAELAALEEAAVMAVQRYMRHAGGRVPLE